MGIFSKKSKYALSDILKGLHNAVNSTQEMLQAQQVQNLTKFWQANDGTPSRRICNLTVVSIRVYNSIKEEPSKQGEVLLRYK